MQKSKFVCAQGFLPTEASVLEVEVWGLGGKSAREIQDSYKKREELFTGQRRKVTKYLQEFDCIWLSYIVLMSIFLQCRSKRLQIDLKTFANWEDSPEKMMMDMMSNPNAVKREDR